jgi:hypothetical protein
MFCVKIALKAVRRATQKSRRRMMMLNYNDSVRSGSPAYRRRQKPIVEVLILPM